MTMTIAKHPGPCVTPADRHEYGPKVGVKGGSSLRQTCERCGLRRVVYPEPVFGTRVWFFWSKRSDHAAAG